MQKTLNLLPITPFTPSRSVVVVTHHLIGLLVFLSLQ